EAVHVAEGSIASDIGFRTGDRLLAVNGKPLEVYEPTGGLAALSADRATFTVERGGEPVTLTAPEDLASRLNSAKGDCGVSALPALVGSVAMDGPAGQAGLRPGDRIVAIDGEPVRFWVELSERIQRTDGEAVTVRWARPDSLADPDLA